MPRRPGGLTGRRTLTTKRGWVRAAAVPGVVLGLGLALLFGGGKVAATRAYGGGVYGAAGLTVADLTWKRVVYNVTTKPGFRRLFGMTLAGAGAVGVAIAYGGSMRKVRRKVLKGEVRVRGRRGVVVEF